MQLPFREDGRNACRRRTFFFVARVALTIGFALSTGMAGTRFPKERSSPLAADYIAALATANRFLQAWQAQDESAGILLLTNNARRQTSEEIIAVFFSTASLPAYEITRGKKIRNGLYIFPVTLFDGAENGPSRKRTRKLNLIVARTGKNDWAVDKLP